MVVEYLKYQVLQGSLEKFILVDKEVWNSYLSFQKDFIKKEVWYDDKNQDCLIFVIYWENKESMSLIPDSELAQKEREFIKKFGSTKYRLVESNVFELLD